MGIRDKPIAPGSPWQNAFAERLIGSIQRECLDHMVVLGETHLRRMLRSYARYYNEIRTHRSLGKDAPLIRPVQRIGHIVSNAVVGGLQRSDRIPLGREGQNDRVRLIAHRSMFGYRPPNTWQPQRKGCAVAERCRLSILSWAIICGGIIMNTATHRASSERS
jgi:hypothetical protein